MSVIAMLCQLRRDIILQSSIRLFDHIVAGLPQPGRTMRLCIVFDLYNIVHVQCGIEMSNYECPKGNILGRELDKSRQSIPVVS